MTRARDGDVIDGYIMLQGRRDGGFFLFFGSTRARVDPGALTWRRAVTEPHLASHPRWSLGGVGDNVGDGVGASGALEK
jgi:hypothetical protein